MSLPSPKNSAQNKNEYDVVIVGNRWTAKLAGVAFAKTSTRVLMLEHEVKPPSPWMPVTIGNGECRRSAELIFGPEIAKTFWDLSKRNFSRAQTLLQDIGLNIPARGIQWFAATEREKHLLGDSETLLGEGLQFPVDEFASRIAAKINAETLGVREFRLIRTLERIEQKEAFRYQLTFDETKTVETSLVWVIDDVLIPKLFASCRDKVIPVTLSSFVFPAKKTFAFEGAVFNNGVDFAWSEPGAWRLGSYRNLFEDKAAGVQSAADAMTLKGVSQFFSQRGWIESDQNPTAEHLSVEAISCDGLPLVGTLSEFPGVFVCGGFAARTANFLFEIAPGLAAGMLAKGDFSEIARFSTKRFI